MTNLRFYGTLGKFTWRLLATDLVGQSILLAFGGLVARGFAIADGRPGDGTRALTVGLALAGLALVAAGTMRRPYGVTLGWIVQAATWLCALVVPGMIIVGLVFTGLWVLFLVQGQRADATVAQREAAARLG